MIPSTPPRSPFSLGAAAWWLIVAVLLVVIALAVLYM